MKYTLRRTDTNGNRSHPMGWPAIRSLLHEKLERRHDPIVEIIHFDGDRDAIIETRFKTDSALGVVKDRVTPPKPAYSLAKVRSDIGRWAVRSVEVEPAVDPVRTAMLDWCWWAIEHDAPIHYSQARPFPLYAPGSVPMTLDCSASTITFARWAGAPNPSGAAPGYGNSMSIASFAKEIPRSAIEAGDIAVFGEPVTHHVAVVLEPGDDPLMESHGQESGPLSIRLSVEARYHSGDPIRFYSLTEPK